MVRKKTIEQREQRRTANKRKLKLFESSIVFNISKMITVPIKQCPLTSKPSQIDLLIKQSPAFDKWLAEQVPTFSNILRKCP